MNYDYLDLINLLYVFEFVDMIFVMDFFICVKEGVRNIVVVLMEIVLFDVRVLLCK